MREDDAKAQLLGQISVKRHLVALAKQMILGRPAGSQVQFQDLVGSFMQQQAVVQPEHVNLNERADTETDLRVAAKAITCELAVAQAVAELIGQGRIMFHAAMRHRYPNQKHTTVFGGLGGSTGGFRLEELSYAVPDHLLVSVASSHQDAFDPDIVVLEAGVSTADSGVQDALKDAAACLAHDLYRQRRPCWGAPQKALGLSWV